MLYSKSPSYWSPDCVTDKKELLTHHSSFRVNNNGDQRNTHYLIRLTEIHPSIRIESYPLWIKHGSVDSGEE